VNKSFSREWWAERLPLIRAYVDGEVIFYEGESCDQPEFGGPIKNYTIAPKTITVNGFEVPAPETVAPKMGSDYFIPALSEEPMLNFCEWDNHKFDVWRLTNGLVYLNEDHAIARAKAMLGTDPTEDCK
jgi:hypothetical protein